MTSVSNERHFALDSATIFRPYVVSHCSGVTKICEMALPAHVLKAGPVRLKSMNNEGHFTLEAKTSFRPISLLIRVGSLTYAT
jgi:hypothetical protein